MKKDTNTILKFIPITSIGFKKCPLLPIKLLVIEVIRPIQLDNKIKKSSEDKPLYDDPKIHNICCGKRKTTNITNPVNKKSNI